MFQIFELLWTIKQSVDNNNWFVSLRARGSKKKDYKSKDDKWQHLSRVKFNKNEWSETSERLYKSGYLTIASLFGMCESTHFILHLGFMSKN